VSLFDIINQDHHTYVKDNRLGSCVISELLAIALPSHVVADNLISSIESMHQIWNHDSHDRVSTGRTYHITSNNVRHQFSVAYVG